MVPSCFPSFPGATRTPIWVCGSLASTLFPSQGNFNLNLIVANRLKLGDALNVSPDNLLLLSALYHMIPMGKSSDCK